MQILNFFADCKEAEQLLVILLNSTIQYIKWSEIERENYERKWRDYERKNIEEILNMYLD